MSKNVVAAAAAAPLENEFIVAGMPLTQHRRKEGLLKGNNGADTVQYGVDTTVS